MVYIPTNPVEAPGSSTPQDVTEELFCQRVVTAHFIAAEPSIITLVPRVSGRTPTGGTSMVDGPARLPQKFKVIMTSPAGGNIEQRTGDGTERQTDFILLGEWDAAIAVGDHWTDGLGQRWEVKALVPENGYERRAVVEAHGKYLEGG